MRERLAGFRFVVVGLALAGLIAFMARPAHGRPISVNAPPYVIHAADDAARMYDYRLPFHIEVVSWRTPRGLRDMLLDSGDLSMAIEYDRNRNGQKIGTSRLILLSPNMGLEEMAEAVRHEVAHLINWDINGYYVQEHGSDFAEICERVGGSDC